MNCTDVENFRIKLFDMVNNCNLPLSIAFYVVKDFYKDFNLVYLNTLQLEKLENISNLENEIKLEYNTEAENKDNQEE